MDRKFTEQALIEIKRFEDEVNTYFDQVGDLTKRKYGTPKRSFIFLLSDPKSQWKMGNPPEILLKKVENLREVFKNDFIHSDESIGVRSCSHTPLFRRLAKTNGLRAWEWALIKDFFDTYLELTTQER